MPSREDEALTWEGDDDPTLQPGGDALADGGAPDAEPQASPDAESPSPDGRHAVGGGGGGGDAVPEGSEPADADRRADAEERAPLGNVALVSLGLLGGVYLLWSVGWFLGATRLRDRIETSTDAVADFMYLGSMWLAVASPLIWFAVVWLGTRRAPLWQRFLWLVAGAVLLVPWPFVMVGVIGQ
ncbi:DNA polymerase III subunit gamma/tau [Microbacterium betulae]|uniref:DNA polymerase III subunit gamma/tau n=1 Tax=Microbacterium betulae TaxID=2981139 RepID=A0AA97FG82_9MICO|nr:DNA polymerase III subunit gamma/tau [Microbacterium sp. AB]WOF21695.1 DNA polymerase III subunit gamma/tau [Microbacterium sp. AB]